MLLGIGERRTTPYTSVYVFWKSNVPQDYFINTPLHIFQSPVGIVDPTRLFTDNFKLKRLIVLPRVARKVFQGRPRYTEHPAQLIQRQDQPLGHFVCPFDQKPVAMDALVLLMH
jgi:hypothetical protein